METTASCWRDVSAVLAAGIDRVILYGPPGTGKTYAGLTLGVSAAGVERLVCTEDLTAAEVTGAFLPVGDGAWKWQEGPAIRSWRSGGRLLVDEVDRASGDVLSLLLAMTDSDGSAQWHHPSTGDVVRPTAGFSVVMTSNVESVNELPPALRDRFPVAIRIDQPHPSAVIALSPDLRLPALHGSLGAPPRRVSLRTFYAFDQLRRSLDANRAAEILFGSDHAQEFLDALIIGAMAS